MVFWQFRMPMQQPSFNDSLLSQRAGPGKMKLGRGVQGCVIDLQLCLEPISQVVGLYCHPS